MTNPMFKLRSKRKNDCSLQRKTAAHFLLIPELLYSPPNHAIINAYLARDYIVHVFSPGNIASDTKYGENVSTFNISYTWSWILKNCIGFSWFKYQWISGTSEDPLAIVAILSFLYGKKSFALVDEIKSDSYRGDRSEQWKRICKWCIKRSSFKIVNDQHRIELLKDYARLKENASIIVYPGCFMERPQIEKSSQEVKISWGFPNDAFVIGSSGGFNLTAGADWLVDSMRDVHDIYAVIQPLGVSPLSVFLLEKLNYGDRLFIQRYRLEWFDAWRLAIGFDIGLCIYTNPAAQFQRMGISSNRLCMFIAMGVPVIASKQESFKFLEEYDCGILVDSFEEFKAAIEDIRNRHSIMKKNCEECYQNYIKPSEAFQILLRTIDHFSIR
jgi:glycosyltransferase involved in cell wall biosynthesis